MTKRKSKTRTSAGRPLGPPRRAMSFRLLEWVADKLQDVSTERTARGEHPHAMNAIVDEALAEWFERNGYGK